MRFNIIFILLLFLTLSFQSSFAGAEEEKKAEGGEHGEGHEGGEGKAKTKEPEWVALQNQINQLESRIQQKKESIEKLIEEKHHAKEGSAEIKEIVQQMVSEYKEMQKATTEFDSKIVILKYRFPERGLKGERKYEPLELKSLEDMEKELGTDGRLSRNQQKIRSQYGVKLKSESASEKQEKIPALKKNEEKSIDEAGSIILEK